MTDRLADVTQRLGGIRQLGAVVNAMRGIAGARAQQARRQLAAVETYAQTIAAAIGRAMAMMPAGAASGRHGGRDGRALVVFCAEQGFAGAFNEHILDWIRDEISGQAIGKPRLFLIGSRGSTVAAERHIIPDWTHALPSHSSGIPKLADTIAEALYAPISTGEITLLVTIFARWQVGQGVSLVRRQLFPLDESAFPPPKDNTAPLVNLRPAELLTDLTAAYLHAQLCDAALQAFAAENEARMEAMAAARREIDRQIVTLEGQQRIIRQDEITAEIIELATGEAASLDG